MTHSERGAVRERREMTGISFSTKRPAQVSPPHLAFEQHPRPTVPSSIPIYNARCGLILRLNVRRVAFLKHENEGKYCRDHVVLISHPFPVFVKEKCRGRLKADLAKAPHGFSDSDTEDHPALQTLLLNRFLQTPL